MSDFPQTLDQACETLSDADGLLDTIRFLAGQIIVADELHASSALADALGVCAEKVAAQLSQALTLIRSATSEQPHDATGGLQ